MEWIAGALPFLIVLACPIGMFLMMRMMGASGQRASLGPEGIAAPARGDAQRRLALLELRQDELGREIAAARRYLEQAAVAVHRPEQDLVGHGSSDGA